MNKYIDNIFKLLYSPIVTPYNLLENAKLKNYSYVKYYKGSDGLITEMKCIVDGIDYDNLDISNIYTGKNENIIFEVEWI